MSQAPLNDQNESQIKLLKKKKKKKPNYGYSLGFGSLSKNMNSAPSLEIRDESIGGGMPVQPALKNMQTAGGAQILVLGEIQEEGQNERSD